LSQYRTISFTECGLVGSARALKLSHEFSGGTIDEGDFLDRSARRLHPILGSGLTECYSSSVSQFVVETVAYALRKGALYLCLYRVWYADSELAEFSVGLIPGLVGSYKEGAA
jgi:hypothetical protein